VQLVVQLLEMQGKVQKWVQQWEERLEECRDLGREEGNALVGDTKKMLFKFKRGAVCVRKETNLGRHYHYISNNSGPVYPQ